MKFIFCSKIKLYVYIYILLFCSFHSFSRGPITCANMPDLSVVVRAGEKHNEISELISNCSETSEEC